MKRIRRPSLALWLLIPALVLLFAACVPTFPHVTSLSLSSSSITVSTGGSNSVTVRIDRSSGRQAGGEGSANLTPAADVVLDVEGLPAGVSVDFSMNPAYDGSLVTLTAAATATPGEYSVTVVGTVGGQEHRADLAVRIEVGTQPPSTVVVDPSVVPTVPPQPPLGDGRPRPVAAISDGAGVPAAFVSNELVITTDDPSALDAFVSRWYGTVLASVDPEEYGFPELPTSYLVRIDPAAADTEALVGNLARLAPEARGDLWVSSSQGVRLLAVAAAEATGANDLTVGMNWISQGDAFADRVSQEAPIHSADSGYVGNAFQWDYMGTQAGAGAVQNIGVAEAWRALEAAGKLGNQVRIAIIDGGFRENPDFPTYTSFSVRPDRSAMNSKGPGNSPWHGTDVAMSAAALADNGYGTAGPAGPVATLDLIYSSYDYFFANIAVLAAYDRGARIIVMSFHTRVPFLASWSVLPFNATTAALRSAGALPFASAGNSGDNVDAEDCFIWCWEEAWYTPCENDGVICVGGLADGSTSRHPNSNYGPEDVDVYAPYVVYLNADPTSPQTNAVRTGNGTSYSTPFAAGVAALIWAADPSQSSSQVRDNLVASFHAKGSETRYVNALGGVLRVLGNISPTVAITSPQPGASFSHLQPVTFTATSDDFEDGAGCCEIRWTSDRDGYLGTGASITSTFELAKPGPRTITATARDAQGATGSATVSFEVFLAPDEFEVNDTLPTAASPSEGFHPATLHVATDVDHYRFSLEETLDPNLQVFRFKVGFADEPLTLQVFKDGVDLGTAPPSTTPSIQVTDPGEYVVKLSGSTRTHYGFFLGRSAGEGLIPGDFPVPVDDFWFIDPTVQPARWLIGERDGFVFEQTERYLGVYDGFTLSGQGLTIALYSDGGDILARGEPVRGADGVQHLSFDGTESGRIYALVVERVELPDDPSGRLPLVSYDLNWQ